MTATSSRPSRDFRSDTVTCPTPAMRLAMLDAPVGDDVYGEDPSVNALEAELARRTGKPDALFVPSGTQSNLIALLVHCGRGDELITCEGFHTYAYEAGGAAAVGGIQTRLLPLPDAELPDPDTLRAAIQPANVHFAMPRLLALENTHNGRAWPLTAMRALTGVAHEAGLATHLDGARLFNAHVHTGESIAALVRPFDSVSICLSKGLGAPVGSVLCGSTDFIARARHERKRLGGGMRQAGFLAAAGTHALTHHVSRLADDHARAQRLAEGLRAALPEHAEAITCATNMVFTAFPTPLLERLHAWMAQHGVRFAPRGRWVTHLDIDDADVAAVVELARTFAANHLPRERSA